MYEFGLHSRLAALLPAYGRLAEARFRIARLLGYSSYAELAAEDSGMPGGAVGALQLMESMAKALGRSAAPQLLVGASKITSAAGAARAALAAADGYLPAAATAADAGGSSRGGGSSGSAALNSDGDSWDPSNAATGASSGAAGGSGCPYEPYLQLDGVLAGIGQLLADEWGVQLSPAAPAAGEVWNASVRKLCVADSNNASLGVLYVDPSGYYGTRMLQFAVPVPANSMGATADGAMAAGTPAAAAAAAGTPAVAAIGLASRGQLHGGNLALGLWELLHEMGHALHYLLSARGVAGCPDTLCAADSGNALLGTDGDVFEALFGTVASGAVSSVSSNGASSAASSGSSSGSGGSASATGATGGSSSGGTAGEGGYDASRHKGWRPYHSHAIWAPLLLQETPAHYFERYTTSPAHLQAYVLYAPVSSSFLYRHLFIKLHTWLGL